MNTQLRKSALFSRTEEVQEIYGKTLHCFLPYTNFIALLCCLLLKAHSQIFT